MNRRDFLAAGLLSTVGLGHAGAQGACVLDLSGLVVESGDSPFFTHYHSIYIPVQVILAPPSDGIVLASSPIDLDSYESNEFERFIGSSGLEKDELLKHNHAVTIRQSELIRIGNGEKDVEIRVISARGNYVHNFKITANQATLAKVAKKDGEK